MLESFIVYIFLFVVMLICGVLAAQREPAYVPFSGDYTTNKRFLQPEIIFLIVAFTFVFGCRWGVGVDYFHYLSSYMRGYMEAERIEPLYKAIAQFLYRSGFHFSVFFSLWAFMEIFLVYYTLRNYRFIFPLFAFFLIIGFSWMSMMNVIRQQLAACIFLFSLHYIENKKIIPYYLCILIAYLFHQSAIILVIVYPLLRYRDDWYRSIPLQIIFYIVCLVLSRTTFVVEWIEKPFIWFGETFGYERYGYGVLSIESLDDRSQFGRNSGLGIYTNIIKIVPVILMSKELKKYYNSRFFNIIYTLWFTLVTFGTLVKDSITLYRPFVYLVNMSPIIYAFFCYYCFHSKKTVLQMTAGLIMLVQIVLFINFVSYGDFNTSTFTFYWQH